MRLLEEKVAVITGAGSGMGRACVEVFARDGAKVLAGDISGKQDVTAASCGESVIPIHCDITSEADVAAMIDMALDRFGRVDAVLNVAGIPFNKPLVDVSAEEYDSTMAVLQRGAFFGTKHAVRAMLGQGTGTILNWSSIGGINASSTTSVYSAAKAGVIAMTKAAAVEYGPHGIRAIAICPGYILTEGMGKRGSNGRGELMEKAPLGRAGEPEEVAEVAAFLASDRASYISGVVLPIDGGWTAKLA